MVGWLNCYICYVSMFCYILCVFGQLNECRQMSSKLYPAVDGSRADLSSGSLEHQPQQEFSRKNIGSAVRSHVKQNICNFK